MEQPAKLADIVDFAGIEVERILPGTADNLWQHLTQSDKIAQWLGITEFPQGLGGTFKMRFQFDEPPAPPDTHTVVHGVITDWRPNESLAYTWQVVVDGIEYPRSEVAFYLRPRSKTVVLQLLHQPVLGDYLAPTVAGWHAYLQVLEDCLSERPSRRFMEIFKEILPKCENLTRSRH